MKKEKLFTIGQFAALHRINKKTLMWYDTIGLFKPAVIKENQYRCYTYDQSSMLETIRMLRELDMSIPEIKNFLDNRSEEAFARLLSRKISDVEQAITRLKSIRVTLEHQHKVCEELLNTDLSRIEIIKQEEEYLCIAASDSETSLESDIEKMVELINKYHMKNLHGTTYGSLISTASLLNSRFDQYDGLFMKVPQPDCLINLHVKPGGKYLRAYCKGAWDLLPRRYKEILEFASINKIQLCGYAYETGINEIMISSIDDYITQIEIPVLLTPSETP